ncbi:MAG TPA: choice-of-anchor Q domain-containing protein, partial [Chloroflexota bacterium]|nr:choice-of-anchor Q domain-containing protein [Chloroflexota bacterium]
MLNGHCPSTEADIIYLLRNYDDSQLSCPSPTTIAFTTPIELKSARQLDASQSVAPITFDGGHTAGQTNGVQFFSVDSSGSLELDGLTLQHGYAASGLNAGAIFGYNVTLNGCRLLDNTDATPDGGGGAILSDGDLHVINTTLSNNSLDGVGGGIVVFGGTATITASTFSNNSATTTNNADGAGGAIFVVQGSTNISGSTFTDNSAPSAGGAGGGALYTYDNTSATISGSTFSDNSSGSTTTGGGAVGEQLASLSVTDSNLTNNSTSASSGGGAIALAGGATTIARSTFSGNTASGGGGGIVAENAMGHSGATFTLTGSALSGNSVGGDSAGGGLLTDNGVSATVTNDTFVGNSALGGGAIGNGGGATLTVRNSTLSGNTTRSVFGGGIYNNNATLSAAGSIFVGRSDCALSGGTFTDLGYNLGDLYDADCGFSAPTDLLNASANLEGLADNGGPTQTMALGPGSQAVDAIPTSAMAGGSPVCPATDQRGASRPDNGEFACDMGSYEQVEITCPTYAQVKSLLTTPPQVADERFALICSTGPDDIDFSAGGGGTITPTQGITLDATPSPYPIIFDGHGTTQLIALNGGSLGLYGLTLAHGYSSSQPGGALFVQSGTASVSDSTFYDDATGQSGGAVGNEGTLSVASSTFTGNASYGGNGTAIASTGNLTIANSTISGNAGFASALAILQGGLTISGTILGPNAGGDCSYDFGGGVSLTDGGYNLSDAGAICAGSQPTDIVNSNPLLKPLADNGGPTETLATGYGSPAVGAIPPSATFNSASICQPADQRGAPPENFQGSCDIGAYNQFLLGCPAWTDINGLMTYGAIVPRMLWVLACSSPDDVDFSAATAGTMTVSPSIALDASTSPAPITLDGKGTTQLLVVNGGYLGLDGLSLDGGYVRSGDGGALLVDGGTVNIADSTLADDIAVSGGGIFVKPNANLVVKNSTFSGDEGLATGAVLNQGTASITASTFSGSLSGLGGTGGVSNSGSLTLGSTIIAQSHGSDCTNSGTMTDAGYNLIDDSGAACGLTMGTDLFNTNPLFDPRGLQSNFGPTPTIALQPASPAVDAIATSSSACLATDQRGAARPDTGETACDVGAYERVDPNDLGCPTYASLAGAVAAAEFGQALTLECSSPTTISFSPNAVSKPGGGTITTGTSLTIDAGGSPAAITFDGNGDTELFSVMHGTLGLTGLTLARGSAAAGGAVNVNGNALVVTDSSFQNNSATSTSQNVTAVGGAISFGVLFTLPQADGNVTITNSTFNGNSASSGAGGAVAGLGTATLNNSTFFGNSALGGGAVFAEGALTATGSTFAGNSGAVSGTGGGLTFEGVAGTGDLTLDSTVVVNSGAAGNCANVGGTIVDGGYNVTDDSTCGLTNGTNHDVVVNAGGAGVASQLGSFGGPTQTLAMLSGSPAIGAGDPTACAAAGVDQRGYSRHVTTCDSGAFETGARPDFGDVPASGPGATNLFPNAVHTGSGGVSLTIEGQGFGGTQGAGSVSVGGSSAGVGYTSWSDSKIVVTVPATDTATARVEEIQVKAAGGGVSNRLPLYVTPAPASVSAFTGNANTGADTASVGGEGPGTPGNISVAMSGGANGADVQVAQFTEDPTAFSLSGAQDYFDAHLSGPAPASVTVGDCTPGNGSIDWFNLAVEAWQQVQPASAVSVANGCVQATLTKSTTPALSDLTGALLAGSQTGMVANPLTITALPQSVTYGQPVDATPSGATVSVTNLNNGDDIGTLVASGLELHTAYSPGRAHGWAGHHSIFPAGL